MIDLVVSRQSRSNSLRVEKLNPIRSKSENTDLKQSALAISKITQHTKNYKLQNQAHYKCALKSTCTLTLLRIPAHPHRKS